MTQLQFMAMFFLFAAPHGSALWGIGVAAGIFEIVWTQITVMRKRYEKTKQDGGDEFWPWCERCHSYHHPDTQHID